MVVKLSMLLVSPVCLFLATVLIAGMYLLLSSGYYIEIDLSLIAINVTSSTNPGIFQAFYSFPAIINIWVAPLPVKPLPLIALGGGHMP
jgi:hypothetical protein